MTLPDLSWTPTPNQSSRNGHTATLVVVHRWAGGTFPGVVAEFERPSSQASAHIVYNGETGPHKRACTQMVRYGEKAWTQYPTFNLIGVSVECGDAMWRGHDPEGFARAARIVAFLLQHLKQPPVWVHGANLVDKPHGFTRHYDLGALGGGHTDPTTDLTVWTEFCGLVKHEARRGGFRPVWGRD